MSTVVRERRIVKLCDELVDFVLAVQGRKEAVTDKLVAKHFSVSRRTAASRMDELCEKNYARRLPQPKSGAKHYEMLAPVRSRASVVDVPGGAYAVLSCQHLIPLPMRGNKAVVPAKSYRCGECLKNMCAQLGAQPIR